jgi:hypothetical protein
MSSHVWSSGSESRPIGEGSLTELISKKVKSSLPSISVPENNELNLPAVDDGPRDGLPLDTVDGEEEEDADDEEEDEDDEDEEDDDEEDDECFTCCSRSVAYASASMIPRFKAMSKVVRESVRTESFATLRLVATPSPPEPMAPLNTEASGFDVDVDVNVDVEDADGLRLARPLLLPVLLPVVLRRPPPLLPPWDRAVADSGSCPFNPAPPCVATPPCPPWRLAVSRGSTTADGDLRLK